ncbi:MAG: hypothetical protein K2X90_03450 [Candidatus Babeliaceae bacterium]|nr:hypothetical protein [Candidatus Babeliaceae bacterium]
MEKKIKHKDIIKVSALSLLCMTSVLLTSSESSSSSSIALSNTFQVDEVDEDVIVIDAYDDIDPDMTDAARTLLGFSGKPVEAIAQAESLPGAPETQAARRRNEVKSRYRQTKKDEFAKINTPAKKAEIARQTGLPIAMVEAAFNFYSDHPFGKSPITVERIQEVLQKRTNILDRNRENQRRSRQRRSLASQVVLAEINTPAKKAEIARQTGLPIAMVEAAFNFYSDHPYGEPPITAERIQEVLQERKNFAMKHREANKKYRERIKLEAQVVLAEIDTPEKKAEIARQTGLPIAMLEAAFMYYSNHPYGEPPITAERIQELAEKRRKRLARYSEYHQEFRKRKQLAAGKVAVRHADQVI